MVQKRRGGRYQVQLDRPVTEGRTGTDGRAILGFARGGDIRRRQRQGKLQRCRPGASVEQRQPVCWVRELRVAAADRCRVKGIGLALDDRDGIARAISQASAKAVAVDVGHQLCLAADDLNRSFRTGPHALPAPVAFRFVDLDNLPSCHFFGPRRLKMCRCSLLGIFAFIRCANTVAAKSVERMP